MNKKIIYLLIGVLIILGIYYIDNNQQPYSESTTEKTKKASITKDFEGAKLKKEDLIQGCLGGQDCIPSIDNPKFETAMEAEQWLEDEDVVFALDYKGIKRAYAQRILNWHEIVNDTISGEPIAVTFCPLCGTALAFVREVNGVEAQFGVSGFLHNSDLIMYDRNEGNLWQQVTGEAIVGPAARRDELLDVINITTTTWGDWKKNNPDTQVLSVPKNFVRDYSEYPYGTYEENDEIKFAVKNSDQRLHPKKVVYGIIVNDIPRAYTEEKIKQLVSFEDSLGGVSILIERSNAGDVKFTNIDTGETIIHLRSFWFAWAAFNPSTDIFIE